MTISKRQLEERELRKERILTGALNVFKKKGIEGATMDEIAASSGFGKATLYYYFHSMFMLPVMISQQMKLIGQIVILLNNLIYQVYRLLMLK